MKPAISIILGLLIFAGIVGCAKTTPDGSIAPTATTSVSPTSTSSIVTPSSESTEILPTMTQTPAAISPQPLVINTLEGTSIPPIVIVQNTPENTPLPEPTVQEKYFPDALVQIVNPGSDSQLTSPFRVAANLIPGDGNMVNVQLYDKNERLMSDLLLKMVESESGWVYLNEEIKFEISAAGEKAIVVVTTRDEFGRKIAQSASEIFLIQLGKSDITTNSFVKQPFVVQSPKENAEVKGGVVSVTGYAHPFNSNPIIIELLTESGGVLTSKTVYLPRNRDNLNYLPFAADIHYNVGIKTPVRMIIRQRSLFLLNIDIALSSQLLILEP